MRSASGAFPPVIAVDRKARKPMHRQIYDAFRDAIIQGSLRSGQQIPSTRALASDLGISRIPLLNAYAQLLAEGYFEARTGAGTFVSASFPQPVLRGSRAAQAPAVRIARRRVAQRSTAIPRHDEPWMSGSGAFSIGQPAFEHFPVKAWSSLLARHARRLRPSSLKYGDPMGTREFRESVAAYLRTARAVRCDPDQIMAVSGSQQALDICARVLLDPGSPVWVEDPGYPFMRSALEFAGCRIVPVPVNAEGLDIEAGIRLCRRAQAAWVTPSHQYPLGVTMSASRRLRLLEWAGHADAWVVEDDYDSEYRYESMPIASLQGMDQDSRVIYIGTFSKILFPSLRLGYMVIPKDLVSRFVAVRKVTDLSPPHLFQTVLADFIGEGHFARHIRRTRLVYAERREALVSALRRQFGASLEIAGGEAGMHLTMMLPAGSNDAEIARRAAKKGLWLWPLSPTYTGPGARQGLILGFGSTPAKEMPEAVRHLARVIASK